MTAIQSTWSNLTIRTASILLALAILGTACGDDAPATEAGPSEGTPNDTAEVSIHGEESTTGEPEPEPASDLEKEPESVDPCVGPAVAGSVSHTIPVDGMDRPVTVVISDEAAAATEPPSLTVGFHAAGFPSDGVLHFPGRGPTIEIIAQASDAAAPFWSETEGFNERYISMLWSWLVESVCFDHERVVLDGFGQGTVVASVAICSTDIPIEAAVMLFGLTPAIHDCDPTRLVPIFSYDTFGPLPAGGGFWDGEWATPSAVEHALFGVVGAVPDDLAGWAEVYGCVGEATSVTLDDSDDLYERDPEQLSYPDCDVPLVAIGIENGVSETGFEAWEDVAFPSRVADQMDW